MGFLSGLKNFLKSDKGKSIIGSLTGIPMGGDSNPEDYEAPGGIRNIAPPSEFDPNRVRPNPAMMSTDTALPPPARAPLLTTPPPVVAPSAPLPPPARVIAPNMPEPPIANPNAAMEAAFQKTPLPSIGPGSYVSGDNSIRGLAYNDKAPALPAPMRAVPEDAPAIAPDAVAAVPPPQRNVFIGTSTAGMTPAQRAAAKVQTLQTADPQSKVRETPEGFEVAPPHKLSHLKAAGKMFLQRMMAGAPFGLGGMMGAGIEGSIEGGVAPERAQKIMRQGELERAQGQQATAQTLEARGLQNQAQTLNIEQDRQQLLNAPIRQKEAEYEKDRTNFEQGVAQLDKVGSDDPNRQKYIDALQTEADRLSEKYGKKVTLIPGQGKEPARFSVDNQVIEFGPDGKPKVVFGSPKADTTNEYHDQDAEYKYQTQLGEVQAKRAAAEKAAADAETTALDYQKKVSVAAGALTNLDAQMGAMPAQIPDPGGGTMADGVTPKLVPNPALGPLKRQREQLKEQQQAAQKGMEDAYKTQREKQAEALQHVAPPPPPKRSKKAATGANVLPRANLPAAAQRLIQQGKIKNASEAEAYIMANGGVVQ